MKNAEMASFVKLQTAFIGPQNAVNLESKLTNNGWLTQSMPSLRS